MVALWEAQREKPEGHALAPSADELRVRRLVVVDEGGKERTVLEVVNVEGHDVARLRLFDAKGDRKASMTASDQGGSVHVFKKEETDMAMLLAGDESVRLAMYQGDKESMVGLGVEEGEPVLLLQNAAGDRRAVTAGQVHATMASSSTMGGEAQGNRQQPAWHPVRRWRSATGLS